MATVSHLRKNFNIKYINTLKKKKEVKGGKTGGWEGERKREREGKKERRRNRSKVGR